MLLPKSLLPKPPLPAVPPVPLHRTVYFLRPPERERERERERPPLLRERERDLDE